MGELDRRGGAGTRAGRNPQKLRRAAAAGLRPVFGRRIDPAGGAAAGPARSWLRPEPGCGHDRQGDDRDSAEVQEQGAGPSGRQGAQPLPQRRRAGRGCESSMAHGCAKRRSSASGIFIRGWTCRANMAAAGRPSSPGSGRAPCRAPTRPLPACGRLWFRAFC